jgi:hypothetical protein
MSRVLVISLCIAGLLGSARPAHADVELYRSEHGTVALGLMVQVLALAQDVPDPVRSDGRVYLFMKEARFRLSGNHDNYRFHLEIGLGPEDAVVSKTGIALGLLDLNFDVSLLGSKTTYARVGQMKVGYGREQLEYSGSTPFGSRSIESLGFKVGRDVGVALISNPGNLLAMVGVWTGGGRDVPPDHYLPQKLGFPLVAARVGYGNADGPDPMHLDADVVGVPDRVQGGVYLNGLYTHDSFVGHSTVLNVKLVDKSLLLNPNWNPFIAKGPLSAGDWWQVGGDAVVRAPLGNFGVSAEVEGDWAGFANSYGAVHMAGGRTQFALAHGPLELAARYAILFPDKHFASNGVTLTGSDPMHEVTPSLTWHLFGRDLQLTADLPLLFHVPVFTETDVGSYVGTELPDESALVGKKGTVELVNVFEGRLMFQAQF